MSEDVKQALLDGARAAQKGAAGTAFKPPRGLFVYERVYFGSPRWQHPEQPSEHTQEWYKSGPQRDRNREKPVVDAIHGAWDTSRVGAKRLRNESEA